MPKNLLDDYTARFAALREILEPQMRITSFGSHLAGGPPFSLEGAVKGTPGAEASAEDVRRSLLDRAELILDLIDREGFVLQNYPAMEFRGDLIPARVTVNGEVVEPAKQVGIQLWISVQCWPVAKESDDA